MPYRHISLPGLRVQGSRPTISNREIQAGERAWSVSSSSSSDGGDGDAHEIEEAQLFPTSHDEADEADEAYTNIAEMAIEPVERYFPTFDFDGENTECDPLRYLGIGSRFSWINTEELETMIETAAGLDTYFVRSAWDSLRYLLIAIIESNFDEVTETSLREPVNNGDFIMHPRNPRQQKAMKRIGHPSFQWPIPPRFRTSTLQLAVPGVGSAGLPVRCVLIVSVSDSA